MLGLAGVAISGSGLPSSSSLLSPPRGMVGPSIVGSTPASSLSGLQDLKL
jgi:hypothetical protein